MHLKLKRTPGLYIAGFMGSGKTTVGRLLSDRMGWDFIDLDEEIERGEQATISQIFETRGEAEFRVIETKMIRQWIRKVECGAPTVIALGGGAFVQPANFELLENNGLSIWLDCPFEVIEERLTSPETRPLARNRDMLRVLFEERRPFYSKADFRIDAACEPDAAIEKILDLPIWR